MAHIKLTVAVDDEHLDRVGEVSRSLSRAGMNVTQQLDEIGVITGSVEAEHLPSLQTVAGVDSVEAERQYQIAPPEAEVQ